MKKKNNRSHFSNLVMKSTKSSTQTQNVIFEHTVNKKSL